MEEKFFIPIDDAIEGFKHHLDAHDRTILSARFGDGKSFFLSCFMEDPDVAERYTFLTIFPVNYQVVENRDIFELIKRDILLQMLLKGVIETDIEISDAEALALYLQCQPLSFIEGFIPLIAELAPSDEATKAVASAIAIKKVFKTIKQKLDTIKQSDSDQIEQFFNAVEQNPVVGQDAISGIIQKGIQQYKERYPNKRVVLVIEDMDRIDPAHLFRILNVFSAHIDYCYRLGVQPNETLAGNKFGLDKVLFVLDYDNLKSIYSHFYGSNTSFDGYIEKFCSSNHFSYSLQEQRDSYFLSRIEQETGLSKNILNYIIKPGDFKDMSVRKVVNAIEDTGKFVINLTTASTRDGKHVLLHMGILKLIAMLRKLEISDYDIISRLRNAIESKGAYNSGIFMFLAPYLNLACYNNPLGDMRFSKSTDTTNTYHVEYIQGDGKAFCTFSTFMNYDENADKALANQLNKVLLLVAK